MSYASLCTVLKLQRASCHIVLVNSVTYHGIDVLRRQGSQVRTDERSEDRPKAHPVGRAIFLVSLVFDLLMHGACYVLVDQEETSAKVGNKCITLSLRGFIGERNIRRAILE